MQSFTRVAMAVAVLTVGVVAPESASAQALPTASEVIARYVDAIGGKAELAKITSIKQTGVMSVPAASLNAEVETFAAAPNKSAMTAVFPGMGTLSSGYNGAVAWEVNPMQGPRLLADKELAATADGADFYANLFFAPERFASMETVGDTTINGEKAYKVKMVRKATMKESFAYFSATSGLQVASVSTKESQMGVLTSFSTISEYRKFGAVMVPTKVETTSGPQKLVLTVKDVSINSVPDSAFAIPDNVKPLIKP